LRSRLTPNRSIRFCFITFKPRRLAGTVPIQSDRRSSVALSQRSGKVAGPYKLSIQAARSAGRDH
jgi:hypothetical protein